MTDWKQQLFDLGDKDYKRFQCKLIPDIDPDTVIGIRMPVLRKFAADFARTPEANRFLQQLPHQYYDENNLHGLLINQMKQPMIFDALDHFLPFVDNWATCDLLAPTAFKHPSEELNRAIERWLSSNHPYTIRFGIGVLMRFYLDKQFDCGQLRQVATIQNGHYYVRMMVAWYFATALAKQYHATIPYLENECLDIWTHNKTIQKAVESLRIDTETKNYLRSLKRKEKIPYTP